MKRTVIFITLMLATLTTGCGSDESCNWPWCPESKAEHEEIHSMVYIDISLSRDSVSILNALSKMEKIFLAQPKNIASRFIVKVIDSDKSVSALFDNFSKALTDKRYDSIEEFKKKREENAKKMRDSILAYYKNIAPFKESSKQSCICNSLENTSTYFEQLDTNKCKIQLFVFSDMFEECKENSSYFNKDFCTCSGEHRRRKSLKQLMEIVKAYSTKTSLKKYVKPENLYFILDESDGYNESGNFCLKPQEIETLWDEILIKMGYSRHELEKVTFDQSVPMHLMKTQE